MCRIALAPCSPFSVTQELMAETAELARARGVRLHTHMAETVEEEAYCLELFGVRPVEYLEELGWLGDDVWLAHCVHLSDARSRASARRGTGVAHCPSSNARLGAGIAPVVPLVARGRAGRARRRRRRVQRGGRTGRRAAPGVAARAAGGGPAAMTCAEALELGTLHGARCLGRDASSARSKWASSRTSCCGGSTTSITPASTTRSPRWCSARARWRIRCSSTARSWSRTAS